MICYSGHITVICCNSSLPLLMMHGGTLLLQLKEKQNKKNFDANLNLAVKELVPA